MKESRNNNLVNLSVIINIKKNFESKIIDFLSLIYNDSTVLANKKVLNNEDFQKSILEYNPVQLNSEIQESKITHLFMERYNTFKPDEKSTKNKKNYNLVKLFFENHKYFLFIIDALTGHSMNILLEDIYEQPCKSIANDSNTNYIFLYDNIGIIHVFIGIINEGKWIEDNSYKSRKLYTLSLMDKRKDPTLYTISFNSSLFLFVAGGYKENNKNFIPLNEIVVYYSDLNNFVNMQPLLLIKMRYPRLNPILYKIKYKNVNANPYTKIYIMGGNNLNTIKKHKNINTDKNVLLEANEFCETINIEDIYIEITQNFLMNKKKNNNNELNISEIYMEKTYHLDSEGPSIRKKLNYFSECGIVKFMDRNNNKKLLIIGVGKKKRKIYETKYISESQEQIILGYTGINVISNKFLGNSLVCLRDRELYYLDDSNFKMDLHRLNITLTEKNNSASCNCLIF